METPPLSAGLARKAVCAAVLCSFATLMRDYLQIFGDVGVLPFKCNVGEHEKKPPRMERLF